MIFIAVIVVLAVLASITTTVIMIIGKNANLQYNPNFATTTAPTITVPPTSTTTIAQLSSTLTSSVSAIPTAVTTSTPAVTSGPIAISTTTVLTVPPSTAAVPTTATVTVAQTTQSPTPSPAALTYISSNTNLGAYYHVFNQIIPGLLITTEQNAANIWVYNTNTNTRALFSTSTLAGLFGVCNSEESNSLYVASDVAQDIFRIKGSVTQRITSGMVGPVVPGILLSETAIPRDITGVACYGTSPSPNDDIIYFSLYQTAQKTIPEISVGFFVREKINDFQSKEFVNRKFLMKTGLVPIKRYYLLAR